MSYQVIVEYRGMNGQTKTRAVWIEKQKNTLTFDVKRASTFLEKEEVNEVLSDILKYRNNYRELFEGSSFIDVYVYYRPTPSSLFVKNGDSLRLFFEDTLQSSDTY